MTAIIEKAKAFGASLAGIASVTSLKNSPPYEVYDRSPYYQGYDGVEWPVEAKSVLVLALAHDPSEPELDWWDYQPGRTRGNRQLIRIAKSLEQWMSKEFGISARPLPYWVEQGGYCSSSRALCDTQMGEDEANEVIIENWEDEGPPSGVREYCWLVNWPVLWLGKYGGCYAYRTH